MSLEIREVVSAARKHLVEILPEATYADIRMEELERDGQNWAVTFSYLAPGRSSAGSQLIGPRSPFGVGRMAKVVVVNGINGNFVALRQRAA